MGLVVEVGEKVQHLGVVFIGQRDRDLVFVSAEFVDEKQVVVGVLGGQGMGQEVQHDHVLLQPQRQEQVHEPGTGLVAHHDFSAVFALEPELVFLALKVEHVVDFEQGVVFSLLEFLVEREVQRGGQVQLGHESVTRSVEDVVFADVGELRRAFDKVLVPSSKLVSFISDGQVVIVFT